MDYNKLFVDSDIVLDTFLQREPFFKPGQVLLNLAKPEFELFTSALAITNVHYFLKKYTNKTVAKKLVAEIVEVVSVLPFNETHIKSATDSDHRDFEDSIQYFIATENNCTHIITRNIKDYRHSSIPVLTAEQFLRNIL